MYRVFTTQFDEIVTLQDLCDVHPNGFTERTRAQLLDASEALLPKLSPLPASDTPLTLLLDLSGSMRGYRIFHSLVALVAVSRLLSAAGQSFQVLGFTTKSWKGGEVHQAWVNEDRHPPSPGRLNTLRHIIIKDFDTDWADAEFFLPILFKEGMLKENIDGEALAWAAQRHGDTGNIILISDGEPADESTQEVMGETYLQDHFEMVIYDLLDQDITLLRLALGSTHTHIKGLPTVIVPAEGKALTYAQKMMECILKTS